MTVRSEAGFSLVETMVALVVLTSGLLMLAGGSIFVTRDLVRSRQATTAAAIAQDRLDRLRARAASTFPACTSTQFASSTSPVTAYGVTATWTVPTTGINRTVRVITTYAIGTGRYHVDTLSGNIAC
jgi:Tfp pilus assembly protein PilV